LSVCAAPPWWGAEDGVRIGIDLSLVPGERTGGGQYSYQLAAALARVDRRHSYRLYPVFYYIVHPDYPRSEFPASPRMRLAFRHLPSSLVRWLWRAEGSARVKEWLLGRVDVVHSTTFCIPPMSTRKRLVVTIYDLSFVTHPEFHMEANVRHCLAGTREAIERADAILAISEHTRQDLVERMGASPSRVVVTPLAHDSSLRRVTDPARLDEVRRRYGLPERFILFVGTLEPRKNIARLIEAYAALPGTVRRQTGLVIAGGKGWLSDTMRDEVTRRGLGDCVRFIGYVRPEDIAALYSLAAVFAYPSLYEGFGLPVLEAMACGTPVLTSNLSSLPEVAGDAAFLVSPTDRGAIADGLHQLLDDAALAATLTARGLEWSARFSWDRCARETLAVYESL
jgi:glycosyltransferase involved in cell wall biosynthesis